ncbi:MAG: hypothetical protein HY719_02970 [Planctomycetes bacterium]|nr:hypothetical protein [Planctomycetota bacterium]
MAPAPVGGSLYQAEKPRESFIRFLETVHTPGYADNLELQARARGYFNAHEHLAEHNARLKARKARGDTEALATPEVDLESTDRAMLDLKDDLSQSAVTVLEGKGFLTRHAKRAEYEQNILDDSAAQMRALGLPPDRRSLVVVSAPAAGAKAARQDRVYLVLAPEGLWQWYWVERARDDQQAPAGPAGAAAGAAGKTSRVADLEPSPEQVVSELEEELGRTVHQAREMRRLSENAKRERRIHEEEGARLREKVAEWKRRRARLGSPGKTLDAALRALTENRFQEFRDLHVEGAQPRIEEEKARFDALHALVRENKVRFDTARANVDDIPLGATTASAAIPVVSAIDGEAHAERALLRFRLAQVEGAWLIESVTTEPMPPPAPMRK